MYKIILVLLISIIFIGCSSESPLAPYDEPTQPQTQTPTQPQTQTPISTPPSQTPPPTPPPSQQPTPPVVLYVGEIGYVCNGFNTSAVSRNRATDGYIAMYNICGDRSTVSSGSQPRTSSVINDWIINDLRLSVSLRNNLVSDVERYGSTLHFYDAVDGYLRYIYIEIYGDGIGIMKRIAE